MEIIISIILLVAAVSLYDYFTARRWQQVTSSVRNEIVFENRNREYGAYVLRRDYDKRLMLIIFGLFLTFAVAMGAYLIYKNIPKEKVPPPPVDTSQFTAVAPPIDEDVPPPPPQEPPPPMETTVAFLPPVVVNIPVEDPIPTQDDMDDKKAGDKDQKGDDENFDPPVVGGDPEPEVVEEKIEPIETFVEEEAEYLGGYASMMKYIQTHLVYPETEIEMGTQGRVTLRFVVEKDGQVSNVSVVKGLSPECDKAAVKVVRDMPKWKPGKNGGRAVRQWCTLPINFTLN
jgi:protein TonB